MSNFDSCQCNRTHTDGLHNKKASQVVQDLFWTFDIGLHEACVRVGGRAGGRTLRHKFGENFTPVRNLAAVSCKRETTTRFGVNPSAGRLERVAHA